MEKHQLATADFNKAADALTNESQGGIHLDICQGIGKMDPFIGNYAPVFFTYTFYGHLYAAQMYAIKLFDKTSAVTVPKFVEMARLRATKFQHAEESDVLICIKRSERLIKKLDPNIEVLRKRRNTFLAHISRELVFERERLEQAKELTMPQIREVLYEGGKIVNELRLMWDSSMNQLTDRHADDYKKVVSLMSKQLCAEIKAHEEEFAKYGLTTPLPRPRDCA